jgi:hypothetical protein
MNDQELAVYVLRKAGLVIAEHQESGLRDAKETIASSIEVLDWPYLAAAMDLEWDYRLWLVKWFPMLFDILTVFLLVAGCMLLWLNLRPRRRDVTRAPKETYDRAAEAYDPEEFAAQKQPELMAEHGASYLDAFPSEEPVNTDAAQTESATTADQNSYADRVASAMAKLRKPSAGE